MSIATQDRVVGHALVRPFEIQWTREFLDGRSETRPLIVGGMCAVIHVAKDGAYLVRTLGGYRVYVNQDQVIRYSEV